MNDTAGDDQRQCHNGMNTWIPKCPEELKPRIGMSFKTVDDASKFYKQYAYISGFSSRMSTAIKRSDGVMTHRYMVCSKEGFRYKTTLVDTLNPPVQNSKHRMETRCGCMARVCFKISDGGSYVIYSFDEPHNHALVEEIGKQYMNHNKQLSHVHQNIIMQLGKNGIGATTAHRVVKDFCGGQANVDASENDFKNFRRDMKLFIGHNDAQMIVDSLTNKKNTNVGYSFEYYANETGILTRLFWADQVAKADCILFSDAVSFDATYRTNKYDLIFVPFTGIDNHRRSVTLAAGLISREDLDSYTWLLRCFKNFVGNDPGVLVTDQDPSMKAAIVRVFPTSRHRLCMWHITEKIQAKVGLSKCRETDFLSCIKRVIWADYMDQTEFESAWAAMILKYELQSNQWLNDIYKLRSSWIPVYFRDTPMGGLMRTTSRSESENSFFGRYIHGPMTLVEFITGYNNAIDLQRHTRVKMYVESVTSKPQLQSKHALEKHASQVFTRSVFKLIQAEIDHASHLCGIQQMSDDGSDQIYTIRDVEKGYKTFQVRHDQSGDRLKCNCKLLESMGYVCRHLFCVMFFMRIIMIPDYMVNPRWHIEASRRQNPYLYDQEGGSTRQTNDQTMLSSAIWTHVNNAIRNIGNDRVTMQRFHDVIIEFLEKHVPNGAPSQSRNEFFQSVLDMPLPSEITVNNPTPAKNKGSGKRVRGPRELAMSKSKKPQRLCRYCNEIGTHDKRTCPKRLTDEIGTQESMAEHSL